MQETDQPADSHGQAQESVGDGTSQTYLRKETVSGMGYLRTKAGEIQEHYRDHREKAEPKFGFEYAGDLST